MKLLIQSSHKSANSPSTHEQSRISDSTVSHVKPELDGRAITDEQIIQDTFTNNTAINVDSFSEATNDIAGLSQGSIVLVTYLSRNTPVTDIQSRSVDIVTGFKDDVHVSWTQIRNFEMRSPGTFEFTFDPDLNSSKNTVELTTLPGFKPQINDTFLYELRNSKIGMFRISSVSRLALGQDTYHRITATLTDWLDKETRERIERQSTIVAYFDKSKFLSGNHAYLDTDNYLAKNDLSSIRPALVQTYFDRFYDVNMSSFMRPDGIYDPYVVEYWNKKVSVMDEPERPCQLLPTVDNYKKTIWAMMTGSPIRNLSNLDVESDIKHVVNTYWDANITSLLGRRCLIVGDESAWMYSGDSFYARSSEGYEATPPMFRNGAREMIEHQRNFDESAAKLASLLYKETHKHEHYQVKYAAPYPILSNKELLTVWRKINDYADDTRLSDSDAAKASGFIHWYRNTYSGTLSKYELEDRWRHELNIQKGAKLTPDQLINLSKYITEYRKLYPRILSEKDLILTWKLVEKNMSSEDVLDESQEQELLKYILEYKAMHGSPVDDSYDPSGDVAGSVDDIDTVSVIFTDHAKITTLPMPTMEHAQEQNKSPKNYYGLSSAFYNGSSMMDPFEALLYKVMVESKINPKEILATVTEYVTISDNNLAFYQIPMSIYLVDVALRWIREHA